MMGKDYPPYLDYPKPYKPMTNGDRIRAMSDEELADFFILRDSMKKFHGEVLVSGCVIPENMLNSMNEITRIAWLHWLKQLTEVEK